jgi:hypothetical protein
VNDAARVLLALLKLALLAMLMVEDEGPRWRTAVVAGGDSREDLIERND